MPESTGPKKSATEKIAGDLHARSVQPPQGLQPASDVAGQQVVDGGLGNLAAGGEVVDAALLDRLPDSLCESVIHAASLPSKFLEVKPGLQIPKLPLGNQECSDAAMGHPGTIAVRWDVIEARKLERKWNNEQLAKKSGISPATLYNKTSEKSRSRTSLTLKQLEQLAAALDIRLKDVLAVTGLRPVGGGSDTQDPSPGGAPLTAQQLQVVHMMKELDEDQLETFMRVVESTMRSLGFGHPAGAEGAAPGRRTTRPKVRT